MRTNRLIRTLSLTFALLVGGMQTATPLAGWQSTASTDKIVLAKPEAVGFSSESLKELDAAMQGIVDKKHLPGIVTLLARHGQVMSHNAGFTYGLFGNTPVDKMYQATIPLESPSLQAFITEMATLPLLYQPG